MVRSMRLYNALGVPVDADEAAIKKAYKKSALKWHPDRNTENKEEAERKFKEIAEAYEVLGDEKKRRLYDQVGEEYNKMGGGDGEMPQGFGGGGRGGGSFPGGAQFHFSGAPGGGGMGGGDAQKIFEQFFGSGFKPGSSAYDDEDPLSSLFGGGGFGGMMGGMGGMPGGMMGGMGGMPGGMGGGMGGPRKQSKPKGATREFPLELKLSELNDGCVKKRKLTRKRARNGTFVDESNVVEIQCLPGWKAGTKVTYAGEGDEATSTTAGDIVFVVKEAPHEHFVREGDDLIFKPRLSQSESHTVPVPLLSGKPVSVRVPAGSMNTTLPEKGMPIRKKGKVVGTGDILIKPIWVK